jgi:hypothetical protein
MVDDGVDFGWLSGACDIPLAHSDFVTCGYFNVMGVFVAVTVWVLDVGFEPVCSCGPGGVKVLCRGVCLGGGCGNGFGGWYCELWNGVWVVWQL